MQKIANNIKKNYITYILIIIVVSIIGYNQLKDLTIFYKESYYNVTTGNNLEIGEDYNPGYYRIAYHNQNPNKIGDIAGYKFKDGDTVRGFEFSEGNNIWYDLNGGSFEMFPFDFEDNITEINEMGSYYTKEFSSKNYKFCNNGNEQIDITGYSLAKGECRNINLDNYNDGFFSVSSRGKDPDNPYRTVIDFELTLEEIKDEE